MSFVIGTLILKVSSQFNLEYIVREVKMIGMYIKDQNQLKAVQFGKLS